MHSIGWFEFVGTVPESAIGARELEQAEFSNDSEKSGPSVNLQAIPAEQSLQINNQHLIVECDVNRGSMSDPNATGRWDSASVASGGDAHYD